LAVWEYLTLYAERDDGAEAYQVKHYPEPKRKIPEQDLLNELGAEGWELVAVVPAYGGGGMKINHQLYFKRPRNREGQWTTRLDR
jgi:hypothetical protein